MNPSTLRGGLVAAALGLTLALTGCGGSPVSFGSGSSTPADPASSESADGTDPENTDDAGSTDPGAGQSGSDDQDGAAPRIPEFPVLTVPDITSLSGAASRTSSKITAAVSVPGGVQVTGARCDATGRVVNRTGLTVGGADDGSQVISAAGVRNVGAGGAGQVVGSGVTYNVNKDGSGQIISPEGTVSVNKDGSGQFVDGGLSYSVDSDGSGQYVSGAESVSVSADGSGQWVSPEYGSVENHGDGSGQWVGPQGIVVNNGDGSGTWNGAPIRLDPLPPVAPLGKFPKLSTLKPIGKPCGMLIRISAEVLFDFDKANLRPEAGPVLASVAKALTGTKGTVTVNGHTDSKGADDYNLDLSQRRAQSVLAALQADGLTAPLAARGLGETQPVAPNTLKGKDNPAGRQLNRRVEILVSGV
jgi:OOP family OmpA-OmpF porin